MGKNTIPLKVLLERLDELVSKSLNLWELPSDVKFKLLNVSENFTYLLEASGGYKSVLRIHREDYHTEHAIECELMWMDALKMSSTVQTPDCYRGRNGRIIQITSTPRLPDPRFMVLFKFIEGEPPDEDGDLTLHFEELGEISAKMHTHAINWEKSDGLERLIWDLESVFGKQATWGDWRDAPNVDDEVKSVLERVEQSVRERLTAYGKSKGRYGLIHADMRLANLLIEDKNTRVIDFDDCGYGWFMYDFAAGISFMEDDPRIPDLKTAWLTGYQRFRKLDFADLQEIDTLIMLRRMALLAWIGSHIEAPEPQAMANSFATNTVDLGMKYLENS